MPDFHGICDRCGKAIDGMWEPEKPGFTAGWYQIPEDGVGWGKYTNPGERIICDACMWSDPRYQKDYGIIQPIVGEVNADTAALDVNKSQIELLADFIMHNVPGEPSRSEGAGDCAIRLLKQYRALLDAVNAYRMAHSAAEATGAHMLDYTGNVSSTYAEMLHFADLFDPRITR